MLRHYQHENCMINQQRIINSMKRKLLIASKPVLILVFSCEDLSKLTSLFKPHSQLEQCTCCFFLTTMAYDLLSTSFSNHYQTPSLVSKYNHRCLLQYLTTMLLSKKSQFKLLNCIQQSIFYFIPIIITHTIISHYSKFLTLICDRFFNHQY